MKFDHTFLRPGRVRNLTRTIGAYAPLTVASLLLILMIIPANTWNQPTVDATYKGFDPNLIFVNETGYGTSRGVVNILADSINITALPSSQPLVHLLTSTLSFNASMDIDILRNGNGTTPFRLGIWSPRGASGFFWDFGPPPWNFVSAQTLFGGTPGMILVGGVGIQRETLGQYSLNQSYRFEISVDKARGIIEGRLSTVEGPPTGNSMLRITGGAARPGYSDVYHEIVPVQMGKSYSFGGLVKEVPGSAAYKIVVQWLDKSSNQLGAYSGDWSDARLIEGWTSKDITAIAPPNATSARLYLGSADNSTISFANLFFADSSNPNVNLLRNGDFTNGTNGWILSGQSPLYVQLFKPYLVSWQASITADQAPELLSSLRLSMTASASSSSVVASIVLQNYVLTLPHQTWQVVQISDIRATLLLTTFLLLGLVLILAGASKVIIRNARSSDDSMEQTGRLDRLRTYFASRRRLIVIWSTLTLFFLVINAYLVTLGSHPFDMTSQEIWAYTAVRYGPLSLYQLPNTVTLAKVWAGTPYHEAIFPYEPILAYISIAIGQLYRLLHGASGFVIETIQLEILIKSFNVLFALADGAAIYAIMRKLNLNSPQSLVASGLFLFNPAILFSVSIWGATQVISLSLLLASIWFAVARRPFWAWLTLALTCLTRPQMLVPAILVSLIYLRKFRIKESIFAISWSVIIVFLLISPFILGIGPSFPRDVLANTLTVQESGGNEPALSLVSLDAYSIWPLVTYVAAGRTGLSRLFYSSAAPLIGQFSYQQVSQLLTLGVILIASGLLLFSRKARSSTSNYLLVLAFGTIGFLVFETGLAATHYVIGLPFLILCKKSLRNYAYYSIVGIWTMTTFVPMFGSFGFAISNVSYLVPAVYHSVATGYFMNLYSSDLFISFGTIANLVVFAWLALETLMRLRGPELTTVVDT